MTRRLELAVAVFCTAFFAPAVVVMGGIPRLVRGAYLDIRDLWRALAP